MMIIFRLIWFFCRSQFCLRLIFARGFANPLAFKKFISSEEVKINLMEGKLKCISKVDQNQQDNSKDVYPAHAVFERDVIIVVCKHHHKNG